MRRKILAGAVTRSSSAMFVAKWWLWGTVAKWGDECTTEGATYAQPEAAVARRRPQQRSDGGATEAATRAGLWCDGGCFLFDGGATVAASFSPVVRWRSKTDDLNFVDGGAIGDGEVA